MERAPVAAIAAVSPPSCVNGFICEPHPLDKDDLDLAVGFNLKCRHCTGEIFEILGYPKTAPDPSPYYLVEPGQILFRPPHRLKCTSCKTVTPIFDEGKDGYDAVLNDARNYESGEPGVDEEMATPGYFKVMISFFYNIELEELSDLAAEANVPVSDLFDWVSIVGANVGDGDDFEAGYECA